MSDVTVWSSHKINGASDYRLQLNDTHKCHSQWQVCRTAGWFIIDNDPCCMFFRPIITEHLWILLKLRLSIMHSVTHTWQICKSNWPGTMPPISSLNSVTQWNGVTAFLGILLRLGGLEGFVSYLWLDIFWQLQHNMMMTKFISEHLLDMNPVCTCMLSMKVSWFLLSAVQVSF